MCLAKVVPVKRIETKFEMAELAMSRLVMYGKAISDFQLKLNYARYL